MYACAGTGCIRNLLYETTCEQIRLFNAICLAFQKDQISSTVAAGNAILAIPNTSSLSPRFVRQKLCGQQQRLPYQCLLMSSLCIVLHCSGLEGCPKAFQRMATLTSIPPIMPGPLAMLSQVQEVLEAVVCRTSRWLNNSMTS